MSGRIRTIKPEVLEDEVATSLSDAAWRLWVSLWVLADDYGNARVGEKYLAARVWHDTTRDAGAVRDELIELGLIEPYAVNGQRYGHIRGWEKHQRVDNAGKPRVPGLDEDDGTWNTAASDSRIRVVCNSAKQKQLLSAHLAATRGEPPRDAASLRGSRLDPDPDPDPDPDQTGSRRAAAEPDGGSGVRVSLRGSRLPDGWRPSEATIAWARAEGITDPLQALPEFADYWRGVPGSKGVKVDWDATYRNRLRELHGRAKQQRIRPGKVVQGQPDNGPIWKPGEVVGADWKDV